jgi:hypothetical protein
LPRVAQIVNFVNLANHTRQGCSKFRLRREAQARSPEIRSPKSEAGNPRCSKVGLVTRGPKDIGLFQDI